MVRKLIQSIRLYLHRKDKFYGLSISQIGFIPGNQNLYKLALLHKSASRYTKEGTALNYERLEFLGDSILGAIVSELLYKCFPLKDEGFLTCLRSKVVSRESLNELAISIGLDKAVVAKSDISRNKHVYGDVFEAFIGAMFLDQGFVNTQKFINKFIFPNFFNIKDLVTIDRNYKSRLIEWGQKNKTAVSFSINENYRSRKNRFICKISIAGNLKGSGKGASKKEAEQRAAEQVMEILGKETESILEN